MLDVVALAVMERQHRRMLDSRLRGNDTEFVSSTRGRRTKTKTPARAGVLHL
jgi:hypothetical protein